MIQRAAAVILILVAASASVTAQLTPSGRWTVETFVDYAFIEPNITYATVDGIEMKLDVYRPKIKDSKPLPTMVFIHGGGWRRGTKEIYSLRVLPWMEMGWNVVNVEYRMTPAAKAPAAVEDCVCALRWVRDNASRYGFDKSKIVVSGQSAGGHLALMAGMEVNNPAFTANCPGEPMEVSAIVNWFGITDVADLLSGKNKMEFATQWIGEGRLGDRNLTNLVSPLYNVRKDLPPVFTIHGDADDTVPYSHAVRLHQALERVGAPNELFTVKGGNHGDFSKKDSVKAYERMFRFLAARGLKRVDSRR